MRRIVAIKARNDAFARSDEHREMLERHIACLKANNYAPEIIAKYQRQIDEPGIQRTKTRKRRGKVVEIPEVWQGVVTHPQTIRKRKSKIGGKRTKMRKGH